METGDSILKKLDNITYFLEVVRKEMENAVTDSLLEFGNGYSEKMEVKDVQEDDGSVLEGFKVVLDQNRGVIIEFKDGKSVPFSGLETDNMYDIFVRIHSALLDDTVSYN